MTEPTQPRAVPFHEDRTPQTGSRIINETTVRPKGEPVPTWDGHVNKGSKNWQNFSQND